MTRSNPFLPTSLLLAAALAVATAASPPAAFAQADPEDEVSCGSDALEPAPPRLQWLGLTDPSDAITSGEIALRFDNTLDETVDVVVRLLADAGDGKHKSRRLKLKGIPAGRSETRTIALSSLKLATDGMAFAGQIAATARIESESLCAGGACKPLRVRATEPAAPDTDAPDAPRSARRVSDEPLGYGPVFATTAPVWFHPGSEPGTFEVYGREALRTRFGAGDFSGTTAAEPEVDLLRISSGGKFAKHGKKYLAEMGANTYEDDHTAGSPHTPQGPLNLAANVLSFCVKWEIEITDHNKKIKTSSGVHISEDIWNGQPKVPLGGGLFLADKSDGHMVVTARGVEVVARKGGYTEVLTTHPRTGCVAFSGAGEGEYELTVLTRHHDSRGNRMIYHGASLNLPFGFKEVVKLKTAKTATVSVGDYSPEATLAAISGFAMYRTTFGVSNKTMYIRNINTCGKDEDNNPNSDGGANSSAHFDNSGLGAGIAYVRIHDGTRDGCSASDHRRLKFLVTHEIGHAWQLLNQGEFEPGASSSLADAAESVCGTGPGYSINSLEHSSIGAREGMAHFYATVIWNSPADAEAVFTWFGAPNNVESNDSAADGGRLFNTCTTPIKCGKSTVIDWLRHWWDWHTPWVPGSKPNPDVTTLAYGNAINEDGTQESTYYQKLGEAIDAIPSLAVHKASWDHFGKLNGVNTSPTNFTCKVLPYPGCNIANPQDLAGQPGCPCADVETTLSESSFGDDRHYPDGTGSYLFRGPGGPGQYCEDFTPGSPSEAVCNARGSDGAPECMRCGTDTMLSCACSQDSECQSLGDDTLVCWGGQDQGWPGTATGRCMPSADTPQGRGFLGEHPWICLESCTSRGGGDPNRFKCMYDQREDDIPMGHAQCVDVVGCTAPAGWCEQSGDLCNPEEICAIEFDDCCVTECTVAGDCAALGFPAAYACDGLGFCVPPGCEFPESDQEFCNMFR